MKFTPVMLQVARIMVVAVATVVLCPGVRAEAVATGADEEFALLEIAARPLSIPAPAAGQKRTREDFIRDQMRWTPSIGQPGRAFWLWFGLGSGKSK